MLSTIEYNDTINKELHEVEMILKDIGKILI